MEILRMENLSFSYPNQQERAINNINLSVKRGEFILICGESGSGKTTLLKMLKPEITPYGKKSGDIYYNGLEISKTDKQASSCEIGFILQNPDSQIVTDKVWHELAFGLENMGISANIIRRRVAEMANYFGIEEWFHADTDKLSGGQKQILNLASVMVMQPKILILDEPTSQLDPIAASEFISTIQKLNRELGLTVILTEHRLEEVFPIADRVIIMDGGNIILNDNPDKIGSKIPKNHKILMGMPSPIRIFNGLDSHGECPITVKGGRNYLESNFAPCETKTKEYIHSKNIAIELENISFRYTKNSNDILKNAELTIYEGEFFALLGGNGAGKTTILNLMAKLIKPYRGKIKTSGKVAYLPQNPESLFLKETMGEDLRDFATLLNLPEEQIGILCDRFKISHLLERHPYDLSGGEMQKFAMVKVLITGPKIILLDEPTKGLDAYSKHELAEILLNLRKEGITVLAVTHDVEFAAENADRCGLLFDGEIITNDIPEIFFAENNFYTTAANRMARGLFPNAVTCKQVIEYASRQK